MECAFKKEKQKINSKSENELIRTIPESLSGTTHKGLAGKGSYEISTGRGTGLPLKTFRWKNNQEKFTSSLQTIMWWIHTLLGQIVIKACNFSLIKIEKSKIPCDMLFGPFPPFCSVLPLHVIQIC